MVPSFYSPGWPGGCRRRYAAAAASGSRGLAPPAGLGESRSMGHRALLVLLLAIGLAVALLDLWHG
jgi:hypothetical protein